MLWENIDRLRGRERSNGEDVHLYNGDKTLLDKKKEKEELIRYWTHVYQQHANDIDVK